jgi:hypothetical protein
MKGETLLTGIHTLLVHIVPAAWNAVGAYGLSAPGAPAAPHGRAGAVMVGDGATIASGR